MIPRAADGVPTITAPKSSVATDSAIDGCGVVEPVPERLTVDGEPVPLCATASDAARAPPAVGRNATAIVQLAPAATLPGIAQVPPPGSTQSPAFAPPSDAPVIDSVEAPVFETVTLAFALVVPTLVDG